MSGSPGTSRGNQRVPLIYSGTPPAETVIACAAAGAGTFAQAGILGPISARRLYLWLRYNAAAIGGYPAIQVWGCATQTKPATSSADWKMLSFFDGTTVRGAMSGALPANSPPGTVTQEVSRLPAGPLEVATRPALNAADVIPLAYPPIDVSGCRFLQFVYREAGVTATPGSLLVHYSFGTG